MRVLSGIQPSGKLHIGNYFAMMKPAIQLQEEHEAYIFIANYHSQTTVRDPNVLRELTLDVALDFMACGLDPAQTVFYRQSDVPQVTELAWLLSIISPMGLLERCHAYKDKIAKGLPADHGLFAYPVLMAADILAVQSQLVPVGQDQKQHVEVTRDLALKFNANYGETFTIPESMIQSDVAVIPGVDGQKMSKSYDNTIDIFGSKKKIRKSIMRILTDSKTMDDPKDPDTCNVFALYKLFANQDECQGLADRYRSGGMGYGDAKKELWAKFESHFSPMRAKREDLQNNLDYVESVLSDGAERAKEKITPTLDSARIAMGLA